MLLRVRSSSLTAKAKALSSLLYDFFLSFIIAPMPDIPFGGIPDMAFPCADLPIAGMLFPIPEGFSPMFAGFLPIPSGILPPCAAGGILPCPPCIACPFGMLLPIPDGILPIPLGIPMPAGIPLPPLPFLPIAPIPAIIFIISDGAVRSSYIL